MRRVERIMNKYMLYIRRVWQLFLTKWSFFMTDKRFSQIFYRTKLFNIYYLTRLYYVRKIKRANQIVQTRYGDRSILQPIDNIFINDEIFSQNVYDKFRKLNKGDVVVDVGAHVGVFTLKAGSIAAKVVSIEPEPTNFRLLKENVEQNGMKNITIKNVAIANNNGYTKLYLRHQSGLHTIVKSSERFITVKTEKLDDLIKDLNIQKINLLKIDTEGAELVVLKGALNILNKYKPYIVMEYHSATNKKEILTLLKSLKYSCIVKGGYIYAFQ